MLSFGAWWISCILLDGLLPEQLNKVPFNHQTSEVHLRTGNTSLRMPWEPCGPLGPQGTKGLGICPLVSFMSNGLIYKLID